MFLGPAPGFMRFSLQQQLLPSQHLLQPPDCGGVTKKPYLTRLRVLTKHHFLLRLLGMTWRKKLHPLIRGGKQHEGPLALVLAGGGARASFQIGALRYLYDHQGLNPDIFAGTSAGAILASALAQYDNAGEQRKALTQVEEIWSSMTSSTDMFEELEWFATLRTHLPTWMKVISLGHDNQRTSLTQAIQARFADLFSKKDDDRSIEKGSTEGKAASPMETLTTLWEGARAATDLQQIIRGYGKQNSAFQPGNVVNQLLAPDVFDPIRLAAAATTLRISVVGLESGELRYVTGQGEVRDVHDNPTGEEAVNFIDAITASCAIPGVFPPVEINGEHYVDGGIRANLPTDIAYSMGAKQVIAITSGARGPGRVESFEEGDLLEIVMRTAAGIMPDELESLQVRLAQAQGATVIDPVIDVHD